jgi:ubiquinone/menaquinone biosynthesis C-methylase UbiE
MDIEASVARYYTHGHLEDAILDALRASGKNVDALTTADLSAADEFHLGWRAVTVELARDLDLSPGIELLDIGSGIGGPARYFAEAFGCKVIGVDLTEEFVQVATALTARCRLEALATFVRGSGLALPFADERFDRVTLIHVGMNIADKARLFAEARRVLRPSGLFLVYDVMRLDSSELPYPMPWAEHPGSSFVETSLSYQRLLQAAGFVVERELDRRTQTLELGRAMRAQVAQHGVPPLGLHVLMGPASRERLANVMIALERGSIAPIELIARRA